MRLILVSLVLAMSACIESPATDSTKSFVYTSDSMGSIAAGNMVAIEFSRELVIVRNDGQGGFEILDDHVHRGLDAVEVSYHDFDKALDVPINERWQRVKGKRRPGGVVNMILLTIKVDGVSITCQAFVGEKRSAGVIVSCDR